MAGLAPGSDSCAPKIPSTVMAPLVPAIHVFLHAMQQDVDARDKRGHDSGQVRPRNKPGHDD